MSYYGWYDTKTFTLMKKGSICSDCLGKDPNQQTFSSEPLTDHTTNLPSLDGYDYKNYNMDHTKSNIPKNELHKVTVKK